MPLTLRPETPADIPAIRALLQAAFPLPLESILVDSLRSAGRLTFSLVAEKDGAIVGHVALSPVTIENLALPGALGLAPLAVLPAYQKQGIGAALVQHAIAAAQSARHPLLVVLGDPAYYARFGFAPARTLNLVDEYEGADAFRAINLLPDAFPKPPSDQSQLPRRVKYAPEFAIFTP